MGVEALRLKEDLVPFLVGKLYDFVFDARAVTRPYPYYPASIQRREAKIVAQQFMKAQIGIANVAGDLRQGIAGSQERKERGLRVASLFVEVGVIDRTAVDSRRSSCFKPP